ncbi:hypothetical protein NKG05_09275 [Oerskovia sp. M15]
MPTPHRHRVDDVGHPAGMPIHPLPAGPFRTHTALAAGVTPYVLRQRWLGSAVRGVRTIGTADQHDTAARCRAAALVLPAQAAFSHVTALRLLGVEVPWRLGQDHVDSGAHGADGVDAVDAVEPLHVVTRSARRARPGEASSGTSAVRQPWRPPGTAGCS